MRKMGPVIVWKQYLLVLFKFDYIPSTNHVLRLRLFETAYAHYLCDQQLGNAKVTRINSRNSINTTKLSKEKF